MAAADLGEYGRSDPVKFSKGHGLVDLRILFLHESIISRLVYEFIQDGMALFQELLYLLKIRLKLFDGKHLRLPIFLLRE